MPASARRTTPPAARAGQSLVEYTLILAVVALLCIPAISFLQRAQGRVYDNHQQSLNAPSLFNEPATAGDCMNGGWATFNTVQGSYTTAQGTFKNQGDCQSWVSTGGRNAPANP
jgi:Flp pilus assembly pilin Flp